MNATTRRRVPLVAVALAALLVAGCRTEDGQTCRDGSHSTATGKGACSHHGGVKPT